MTNTPFLNLKKPDTSDFYNVDDFNDNADTIDQAFQDLSGGDIAYDHTDTGLSATTTQEAIDEILTMLMNGEAYMVMTDENGVKMTDENGDEILATKTF